MTPDQFREAAAGCTHFLCDHHRKKLRDRFRELSESPLCDERPDNYGRGGFVEKFEREIADLLGKEAAVFMPSGTMAQPIALRIWADRANNKTIAFHPTSHLELHEHMGYRELHHLEAELLGDDSRLFTLDDLKAVEKPIGSLLIELPQREIGGQLPTWDQLRAITDYAKASGMRLHLDGARLWETQPFYGRPYREIVEAFDSVYVSFYKILRGLPGAMLAGPADFIDEARIWMRRQGGNLVVMAPNAISAKIGLDLHVHRIPDYVAKAAEIASILQEFPGVVVEPKAPPTNMMHVYLPTSAERALDACGQIAEQEKTLLFQYFAQSERGTKSEIWIGEAALDVAAERWRELFGQFVGFIEKE